MRRIAEQWRGCEEQVSADISAKAQYVPLLATFKPVEPGARVLEVGSGGTGIIFGWGSGDVVGIDPLADELREIFPWQRNSTVRTIAADGECLPFEDASFDIVLSDNVIDHAGDPQKILVEIARVLRPGGLFYFTVHVHHPIYHYSSLAYGLWKRLGLPGEITPFADHTVHLTVSAAEHLFGRLPLQIVKTRVDRSNDEWQPPRHLGDRLKRLFFKNATFEVVAVRGR